MQTALLATRLRDAGHEVAILAYWGLEGARLDFEGIPVFPRSRHPASQDLMVPLAQQLGCQAIISITDAWVIETQRFAGSEVAYVPWFPCDGEPMDAENARGIAGPGPLVGLPVATSDHAAAMAAAHGITDCRTIRYMVDTATYCPGDRAAAREGWGIPQEAFVVGIVAMNKSVSGIDRKRFFEQIGAFARFRKRNPEALLYLHTHMMAPDGVNMEVILRHHGVPQEAIMATNGFVLTCGAPPELMADLYRSFDLLLGVTGGEGAGMPLLEAAACGVPAVWGDWTAMPEYAKGGVAVPKAKAQEQMNAGRVIWWTPSIEAIDEALQTAYDRPAEPGPLVEAAAAHDADRVVPQLWLPALDEVEQRLEDAQRVTAVSVPEALKGPPVVAGSASA